MLANKGKKVDSLLKLIVFASLFLIFIQAKSQNFRWSKHFNGNNTENITGIAVDANGNSYSVGSYASVLQVDTTLTASGGLDIFIIKRNYAGNLLWAVSAGGAGVDGANDIVVLPSGNIAITGFQSGGFNWGSQNIVSSGARDYFVASLSKINGSLLWIKTAGGGDDDNGNSISCDNQGRIYTTGDFKQSANFGAGGSVSSSGLEDIFIASYTSDGTFNWVKKAGGSQIDRGSAITCDANGNIYFTGEFTPQFSFPNPNPNINFDGQTLNGFNQEDVFLARYNSNGNLQWVQSFGGIGQNGSNDVITDSNGNIYFTGFFIGNILQGTSIIANSIGQLDYFLVKYNPTGGRLWLKTGATAGEDEYYGLAIDNNDKLYVAARFNASTIIGNDTIQSSLNNVDLVIINYDTEGNSEVYLNEPQEGIQRLEHLKCYGNQSLFIGGFFQSSINLGLDNFSLVNVSGNDKDLYLSRLDNAPNPIPICLVTVDSASIYNRIYWEKVGLIGIDTFKIYRETQTNIYQNIASIPFDSLSLYIDTNITGAGFTGDPNAQAHRYKISVIDSIGNESELSPFHKTIFLQNLGGGNLSWSAYEIENGDPAIAFYIIYRDDFANGNFVQIAQTAGNTVNWTDPDAGLFPNALYVVDVIWNISCEPTRTNINTTRSNIPRLFPVKIDKSQTERSGIKIYPNPSDGNFKILLPADNKSEELQIIDLTGKVVYKKLISANSNLSEISIELNQGYYILIVGNAKHGIVISKQK